MTASTMAGSTFAAARAATAAYSPRPVAVTFFSLPPKAPNAVLLAATIYTGRARAMALK